MCCITAGQRLDQSFDQHALRVDMLRGYEHVKMRNVAAYRERAAALLAAL
jgi:hypothetical protein